MKQQQIILFHYNEIIIIIRKYNSTYNYIIPNEFHISTGQRMLSLQIYFSHISIGYFILSTIYFLR